MDKDLAKYVSRDENGKVDVEASNLAYTKALQEWVKKSNSGEPVIKSRNHGERGEDLIASKLGATRSRTKGAADLYYNNRKIGVKDFGKSLPTILNAFRILYKIDPPLTPKQLQEVRDIQSSEYKHDRIAKIYSYGSKLVPIGYDNPDFENCLKDIHPELPSYLAQLFIDCRVKRPKKSLVLHEYSQKYATFSEDIVVEFLYKALIQEIKSNGACDEKIDDVAFRDKYGTETFFLLSNEDHRSIIFSSLRQNAYFDTPSASRYPSYYPLDNNIIYLALQIRLRPHADFNKGMNLQEYEAYTKEKINV